MGAHMNYDMIIFYLVLFKNELHRVQKEKYQELIKELKTYEIDPMSDDDNLPNQKSLVKKLNVSQGKMYSLLKGLYTELVTGLSNPPLKITNYVHQIHIHYPYDEREKMTKDRQEEADKESTFIQLSLPITPRIGDEIDIPFIEHTGHRFRGYVHRVRHEITCNTQEIYIEVHPLHDYYYKWVKMREEFEYWQRFKERMKNEQIF